jgi:hypothetical protein
MRRRSKDPDTHSPAGTAAAHGSADGKPGEDHGQPSQAQSQRPADPAKRLGRRLGTLEYILFALIVIGIAITLAMALVNPAH